MRAFRFVLNDGIFEQYLSMLCAIVLFDELKNKHEHLSKYSVLGEDLILAHNQR